MKAKTLGLLLVGLMAGPICAQAAVTINVSEGAGGVVFTSSGTLDITGVTAGDGISYPNPNEGIISGGTNWYYAQGGGGAVNVFKLTSYAGPFGTNESLDYLYNVGSSTGTPFGIWGSSYNGIPVLLISSTFQSGSSVVGDLTFANESFSSLGLTIGEYVYTIPNDTITIRIGAGTVPEPGTLALLGLSLAGLGLSRRRRAN